MGMQKNRLLFGTMDLKPQILSILYVFNVVMKQIFLSVAWKSTH